MVDWETVDWGNYSAEEPSFDAQYVNGGRSSFSSNTSISSESSLPTLSPSCKEKKSCFRANRRSSWFNNLFENDRDDEEEQQKHIRQGQGVKPSNTLISRLVPLQAESVAINATDFSTPTREASLRRIGGKHSDSVLEGSLNIISRSFSRTNSVKLEPESATVRSADVEVLEQRKGQQKLRRRCSDFSVDKAGSRVSANLLKETFQRRSSALLDYVDKAVQVLGNEDSDDDLEVPFPSQPRKMAYADKAVKGGSDD